MSRRRRTEGSVRKRPSGRYQARVRNPVGDRLVSLGTFATRTDAERAVTMALADQARGAWVDPSGGRERLASYAGDWVRQHPRLRPRTRRLYEDLLRLHILPGLGHLELARLSPRHVRSWYSELRGPCGPGASTAAKSYRLLHAVMATATADELVPKNPCMLANAGREEPEERPVVAVAVVYELAELVDRRYRMLVLMAAFTGLRRSELFGLMRRHIDLLHGTVSVVQQRQQMPDGSIVFNPPKTHAGRRTITIPPPLLPELAAHLDEFAEPGPDSLIFLGVKGGPLREHVWQKHWDWARRQAGLPDLHFHDLRHVANTMAAATGASLRELMHRMGHASPAAALRYQHATQERDAAIANALGELILAAPERPRAAVAPLRPRR